MRCIFVQLCCEPGATYRVAAAIYDREIVSELYSTAGDWDLLAKIYLDEAVDVGLWLNESFLDIPGIQRTLTTMTHKAF